MVGESAIKTLMKSGRGRVAEKAAKKGPPGEGGLSVGVTGIPGRTV
jgi:hypothetical protein